jgi:ubiquinone/menaquinone biosynthesis C-methylase UbiE
MRAFDHFNLIAPFYDRIFPPKADRQWVDLLDLPTTGRLLDVGGGTGRVAQFLSPHTPQLILSDLSLPMLRKSQSKVDLQPVCSIAEILPFPDKSFDRIIMVDAMHHVFEQEIVAGELIRVLKPGGRLLIEEPDIRSIAVKGIAIGEKLLGMRSLFLSPPQIETLFDKFAVEIHTQIDGAIAFILIDRLGELV